MPNSEDKTEAWETIRDDVHAAIQGGLDTPKQIQDLRYQIGRLVSHIDSQRRVEDITSHQLHEQHILLHGLGEQPGLKERVNELMRAFYSLKKMSWVVISMLLVVFVKAVWEVLVKSGIKP